jgi:transcriptional regulator with XRE-family HTH domain
MSTGIGKRIKEVRIELGLSQEELAKRLGLKSKSTICKIETGDDNLSMRSIQKYAKALGCDSSYLIGLDQAMQDKWHKEVLSSIQENISGMQNVVNLSNDEHILIENYRNSSEADREAVKRMLAYAARMRGLK